MTSCRRRFRWARSISEVSVAAWDRLTDDGLNRHGWLRTVEATYRVPQQYRYLLAEDDEALVGAIPCRICERSEAVFTLDDCMLGRFRRPLNRLGISFLPALVCGSVHGCGKHLLFNPSLGRRATRGLTSQLLAEVEAEAERLGLPVAFTGVTEDEGDLLRLPGRSGYCRALDHPTARLDIAWDDFHGYLLHVKKNNGSNHFLRNELNRNTKAGVRITRRGSPPDDDEQLYRLLDLNYRKHNGKGFPFGGGFLTELTRALGADAVVYVAEKGRALTGVSVLLKNGATGHMLAAGVDHEVSGKDFTYFNIGYYRPIADAVEAGMTELDFGAASYQTKRRRGCTVRNAHVFYKPRRNHLGVPLAAYSMIQSAAKPYFVDSKQRKPRPGGRG